MAAQSLEDYIDNFLTPTGPSDEEACPICTDAWNAEEMEIVATHCNHTFHRTCLVEWLRNVFVSSANTCPSCRSKCFQVYYEADEVDQNSGFSDNDETNYEYEYTGTYSVDTIRRIAALTEHIAIHLSHDLTPTEVLERYEIDLTDTTQSGQFQEAIDRVYDLYYVQSPEMWSYHFADSDEVPEMADEDCVSLLNGLIRWHIINNICQHSGQAMNVIEYIVIRDELLEYQEENEIEIASHRHADSNRVLDFVEWLWIHCGDPQPRWSLEVSVVVHG